MIRHRRVATMAAAAMLSVAMDVHAGESSFAIGGHLKTQLTAISYPEDSLFREIFGARTEGMNFDARTVLGLDLGRWRIDADLQLIATHGDRLEFTRDSPQELRSFFPHLPTDRARLFDLTHVVSDSGSTAVLGRFDRLAVGYATDRAVLKFGRQAVSWGNGLIFTAMDIFNPFDPAAVDTEYKSGDDMLYGQFLRTNGDDLQSVVVFRREVAGRRVTADEGSFALKYHGWAGGGEVDALIARHYGDDLIGAGLSFSVGGAVWQGDVVATLTDDDLFTSLVTNLAYSWTWGETNFSGVLEYYRNGFGRSDGCYSSSCLARSPDLLHRLERGEIFTLGRDAFALSAQVEVHPLFLLTPNLLVNLNDPSALFQLVAQNDLGRDWVLLTSLNLPIGPPGSEYGGPPAGLLNRTMSTGASFLLQLARYF